MEAFERCFIMLCDDRTEGECLRRNLFGDKAKKLVDLADIEPGDTGFLLNVSKDELIGAFRACSRAQLHIEPDAWDGRFAAQVRVESTGALKRIKDATFILKQAGVAVGQLASGAPAPQFPVHGQDVTEKLMAHFGNPLERTNYQGDGMER